MDVLTISVAGKTATPSPGGLVGAEAGLFAGLIAFESNNGTALVNVVTYRIVTYWIPFGIGAIAYMLV